MRTSGGAREVHRANLGARGVALLHSRGQSSVGACLEAVVDSAGNPLAANAALCRPVAGVRVFVSSAVPTLALSTCGSAAAASSDEQEPSSRREARWMTFVVTRHPLRTRPTTQCGSPQRSDIGLVTRLRGRRAALYRSVQLHRLRRVGHAACPVDAIQSGEDLPSNLAEFGAINAEYFAAPVHTVRTAECCPSSPPTVAVDPKSCACRLRACCSVCGDRSQRASRRWPGPMCSACSTWRWDATSRSRK